MKLYRSTIETLRRGKRTYVFIFVPFDFRNESQAIKSDIVNDVDNEQRLDDELMWTWFLRNPLRSPKEKK